MMEPKVFKVSFTVIVEEVTEGGEGQLNLKEKAKVGHLAKTLVTTEKDKSCLDTTLVTNH
ncbi:hypothetical protein [Aquibacillus saliphilus]|uniref:hypothetical protein n=1 Tax=Aquibacillus saliphilus TaxID=1909422 RepID=UPI001CF08769|nr:hypothetical protein [Aquibacillus saliphilus]